MEASDRTSMFNQIPTFQVKIAYINFLNHCYVDTEVEMKEIYTSNHMWKLFENFLVDICRVSIAACRLGNVGNTQIQALNSAALMSAGV